MGDKTGIQWTDATWNPLAGCSVISPGCKNCYAMKMAARIEAMSAPQSKPTHYAGTTQRTKAGAVWTGKVNLAPPHILSQPLRWARPRRIFVNSMSDLFHEDVPDAWIDQVFAIMAIAQRHTFQILTKRAARMRDYVRDLKRRQKDWSCSSALDHVQFPLPNVWLGVSVENQRCADERIPLLIDTPAALRFLSCEPLLGPVKLPSVHFHCDLCGGSGMLARFPKGRCHHCDGRGHIPAISTDPQFGTPATPMRFIDWVIAGGESGPGARPMHPAWLRQLRDQCQAASVPFFFKQWGEWLPGFETSFAGTQIDDHTEQSRFDHVVWNTETQTWDRINGSWDDVEQWHIAEDYWQPQQDLMRVGKTRAGNNLEGRQHLEFPKERAA